jgi:hypothetical protein
MPSPSFGQQGVSTVKALASLGKSGRHPAGLAVPRGYQAAFPKHDRTCVLAGNPAGSDIDTVVADATYLLWNCSV